MRISGQWAAVLLAAATLAGCGRNASYTPPSDGPAGAAHAVEAPAVETSGRDAMTRNPGRDPAGDWASGSEAGGVRWSVPDGWSPEAERPMRAATYSIPAVAGDAEAGECAVFYFGPNEGGGVEANIDRWIGQMRQPDNSSSATRAKTRKLTGMLPVTLVDLTGTYLASGGPMMQTTAEKPGFRLLGAIVQGPQGSVFFKFTGPEKTVEANSGKFLAMVQAAALVK